MNNDFRPIPGYPGYVVDKMGCVYGPQQKMMTHQISSGGYFIVNCFINKKVKGLRIHRAVALAWIPNPENLPTVDHINRNKQDNRIENLRWANHRTQCLNKAHRTGELNEKWIYKNGNHYSIQLKINNEKIYAGTFDTLAEAVEERDQILIALEESI